MRLALALGLAVVAACVGTEEPSLEPSLDNVGALVVALNAMEVPARVSGRFRFDDAILGGSGITLCVAGETVNVSRFDNPAEAAAAAATVNRRDPSNIGNAHIDWIGPPKFWLRQELIVYYVGTTAVITGALINVLGQPFAADVAPFGGRGGAGGPARAPC